MIDIRPIPKILSDSQVIINKVIKKYKTDPDHTVDEKLAKLAIKFIAHLKHTGGDLGGVNFQLIPFQVEFIVETIAVIQKKNGFRKHKTVILHVPRKQGS